MSYLDFKKYVWLKNYGNGKVFKKQFQKQKEEKLLVTVGFFSLKNLSVFSNEHLLQRKEKL